MRRFLLCVGTLLATAAAVRAATPPAVVVMALDTSGSIAPADAQRTRELADALLSALPPGSEVALLTFDDQSRIVVPRTASASALKAGLATIRISGRYTALYDALYEASRYLRNAPPTRRAVVLVTDGRDENSALNLDDGLGDARDSGIPIFTVGIGGSEERVLRRIAKLTGGDYAPIADVAPAAIAGRIAAIEPPAAPLETSPVPRATPPAGAAPPVPEPGRGRTALGLVLIGSVLLAAFVTLVVLASRRAPAPAAAAPRSDEGGTTDRIVRKPAAAAEDDGPSPTLMRPFAIPEEALDRTLTLADKPVLVVQEGPLAGRSFVLKRETTTAVGRARANDVVLDDVAVSSQHCRIRHEDGGFVLHDLQSTNGTFVNDQKVSRHRLKPGDVIRVGETPLLFKREQTPA